MQCASPFGVGLYALGQMACASFLNDATKSITPLLYPERYICETFLVYLRGCRNLFRLSVRQLLVCDRIWSSISRPFAAGWMKIIHNSIWCHFLIQWTARSFLGNESQYQSIVTQVNY
jgi:hypothetical protein